MHLHRTLRIGLSLSVLGLAATTGITRLEPSTAEAAGNGASGGVLPPAPNVLLLIDRSGSMARTVGGNVPNCSGGVDSSTLASPDGGGTLNRDRWGQILEGLTGHAKPFYSCDTIDRTSARFKNEFSINGKLPPDADYIVPYNRPLTGATPATACAVTPGYLPGAALVGAPILGDNSLNANGWNPSTDDPRFPPGPKGSIVDRYWQGNVLTVTGAGYGTGNAARCTFDQYKDGQIDIARKFVRFALMTSDSDPSNAVGDYGVSTGNVPWSDLTGGTGTKVDTSKPFDGQWSYLPVSVDLGGPLPKAKLPSCGTNTPFAVGARHNSAPPWEGRMVPFPDPDGPDDANLDQIQRVLLATRPYGGSPLDGMMFDAADYLWRSDDYGPWAPNGKSSSDAFVQSGCRKQYVILISDGASNLDLRPQCQAAGGTCAFPTPAQTARMLYNHSAPVGYGGAPVQASDQVHTFVIGFGAKGSAAPAIPEPAWFTWPTCSAAVAAAGNATAFSTFCAGKQAAPPASLYPPGTMAEACCALNDIAVAGDGGLDDRIGVAQGAFFVESEAEFSLAIGSILGRISASTTSRATPTFTSTYTSRDTPYANNNANASIMTTLTPTPGGLWTSDLIRKRNVCNGGTPTTVAPTDDPNDDLFEHATKAAAKRYFITSVPVPLGGVTYDPTVSFRPFDLVGTNVDKVSRTGSTYATGTEVLIPSSSSGSVGTSNILKPDLLGITATSCDSIFLGSTTPPTTLPKLTTANSCADAVFGFAATYTGPISFNAADYNIRCQGNNSVPNGGIYKLGCHPIGGIFHSQPVVAPPPQAFLADEGYRAFAKTYANRPAVLYTETMDGLLHGFDATNDTPGGPYGNELFAFIPPAVLPTLQSNFPSGVATLLDSPPVVKDVVWERKRTDIGAGAANLWHTMLVAGEPGGYFAMEISDPVAGQISAGTEPGAGATYGPYTPSANTGSATPNAYTPTPLIAGHTAQQDFEPGGTVPSSGRPVGPHFMWQLTTADEFVPEVLTSTGTSRASGVKQYPLFGTRPGKPAITTLYFDSGSGAREVGVAILPGGMPNISPKPGPCARKGGVPPTVVTDSGNSNTYTPRTQVRDWGDGCAAGTAGGGAVPGRSVTIVRLDTGEIMRVFGRKNGAVAQDLPHTIPIGLLTPTPLDSPMTGTPVVYPNDVGAVAQRFYMGDADGTIWRFDVSDPDPTKWSGRIFYDTQNSTVGINPSQPIDLEPIVTQDASGRAVLIAATGDQDNANPSKTPPKNYIVSITERPDSSATTTGYQNALVNWVYGFANPGERVSGPMSVFNNVVYFASYVPPSETVGPACSPGAASIWAFDYIKPTGVNGPTPLLGTPVAPKDNAGTTVTYVPGVTIQAGLQCATAAAGTSSYGAYQSLSFSSTATPTFTVSAMSSTGSAIGGIGGANAPLQVQVPASAQIDSWAAVVE